MSDGEIRNNIETSKIKERDDAIRNYLDSFLLLPDDTAPEKEKGEEGGRPNTLNPNSQIVYDILEKKKERVLCCSRKRCLYCPECLKILFLEDRKEDVVESRVQLPFKLDIALFDRRTSSTGLHAYMLLSESNHNKDHQLTVSGSTEYDEDERVRLFDLERGKDLPDYSKQKDRKTTFILFPSKDSIPLSDVAHNVSRLIVMDCKWTRTNPNYIMSKFNSQEGDDDVIIKKVHLSNPPSSSHYWRWHNAGEGMISTIEAVYCAAWEIEMSRRCGQHICKSNPPSFCHTESETESDTRNNNIIENKNDSITNAADSTVTQQKHDPLLNILFLFAVQRAIIQSKAMKENRTLPYSEHGKEEQRALRRREDVEL